LLGLLLSLACLLVFLLKGGLDLGFHNLLQTSINLATTVDLQAAVSLGDEVPEEDQVQDNRDQKTQGSDYPDDQCEQHRTHGQRLVHVLVEQMLEVGPELLEVGFVVCVAAAIHEGVLHDWVKRHAVDDLTRTFSDNQADGALEGEVHEKGDIIRTLFACRQSGKHEEPSPAWASHTL
jgi:hypothetical protein